MPVPSWMRRVLFGLALVAIPFPYQVVDGGRVPALWLATVAAVVVTSAIRQGGEISAIIARWFAIQAAVAVVLAYAAARMLCALLRRVDPARRTTVFAAIAASAVGAALLPIFAANAVRGGVPTNVFGIFLP
jgi:hypothetical protein